MKKTIRIFPRRTKATPDDTDVRIKVLHPTIKDEADEVHVSVAFTWDIPTVEKIAENWRHVAPVTIGGHAYKDWRRLQREWANPIITAVKCNELDKRLL